MAAQAIRAILLDSFGTLVEMAPPAPLLRRELRRRIGVDVGEGAAERAFAAEIDYYVEHHLEGRDEETLDALRDRCAAVVAAELGDGELDRATVRAAMLASLRFTAHADAAPALRKLRDGGLRLAVASNWDASLPEVLERAGLRELVDAVVASAAVGAAKPDPALFHAALEAVGASPAEALHVGDSFERDVAGARSAGVRAVLLARDGRPGAAGVAAIGSLGELPSLTLPAP